MSRRSDVALFVVLPLIWGLSFPAISIGLEYLPPLLFAALRYDIGAVVLLGFASLRRPEWLPRTRGTVIAIVVGGFLFAAGNGLLFLGQQTVPSGVAAIIGGLIPIATALWAIPLLGERLSGWGAAGVAIGFLGIALIVQPDPGNLLAGDTLGRLLVLGQVLCVSLGGVVVQWADPDLAPVPLAGWSLLVGTLVLHGASVLAGEAPTASATAPVALAALAYVAVVATAVASVLYYGIIASRGAFEVSLVSYLIPVVATVAGVLFLGEVIGPPTFGGFALVAVGFALLRRRALTQSVATALGVGGHG